MFITYVGFFTSLYANKPTSSWTVMSDQRDNKVQMLQKTQCKYEKVKTLDVEDQNNILDDSFKPQTSVKLGIKTNNTSIFGCQPSPQICKSSKVLWRIKRSAENFDDRKSV